MAIRSGAGTGVIVSLVVFVLTTVFLLVLSIVFYAGSREHAQSVDKIEEQFRVYAKQSERGDDDVQNIVSLSKASNLSAVKYLQNQIIERNNILTGNRTAELEEIKTELAKHFSNGSPLAITIKNLERQIASRQTEIESTQTKLANALDQIKSLEDQLDDQVRDSETTVQTVKDQWIEIQEKSKQLNTRVDNLFANRYDQLAEVKLENIGRIELLERNIDRLREENSRLEGAVEDLRDRVESGRMNAVKPAELVDGRVLDVSTGNVVFIDRGSNDRIVHGMTFEVYDSESQLRVGENGDFPRGKASIEVVKVGETTSTAKITRSTSSQPVVRDNIIVNAIYDPNYEYSFLVHGYFDADGDGNPEPSNKFIVNQIESWGGEVVEDTGSLPGDLDFLVLGIAPKEPRPLGKNPSKAMEDAYIRQKAAYVDYEELLNQAHKQQVPVLNTNRLFILTGQGTR
ncbi:MAG: hypothetical protein QF718_02010 [Phycisphaerales bacterium]|jgi:hypothetical protein|nr:hypothetical protein [Phycisphaerales bacterium]